MIEALTHRLTPKAQSYRRLAANLSPSLLLAPPALHYLRYKFTKLRPEAHLTPSYICLVVNRRCQLTCHFCSYGRTLNTKAWRTDELTLARCQEIFEHRYANKALLVQLTGGEPMLNKDIVEIIKYLKGTHRIVSMVSNGLLYKGEKLDAVAAAGLDMLNISIYPENIERLRAILPMVSERIFTKLSLM
jgi:molybdenum cofactor biosynthesis enzyme MoaA